MSDEKDEKTEDAAAAWRRKRRRAEIFGDVLPEVTSDERDSAGDRGDKGDGESASDAWLKSQVPPHHG